MTNAHNPRVLSDADAAADLAGVPRPDRGAPKYASEANTEELLLTSKQPDALHLADALEKSMQYPLHGKAADMLRALVSERDALAGRLRELEAERDAITELNHAQWLALENVRHLAARNRNEEWAQHLLRWCAEAGNAARILRAALTQQEKTNG